MRNLIYFLIVCASFFQMGCKTQSLSITNGKVYQVEIKKGSYTTSRDSIPQSTMTWVKKGGNCDARFETAQSNLCFKYVRKPKYQVQIRDELSGDQLAVISDIKKFESTLKLESGLEYTLKPIKSVLTVLYNEIPIAKVNVKKRVYTLEIDELYFSNELLKAAILYKHAEIQKLNSESNDFMMMMLLFGAM